MEIRAEDGWRPCVGSSRPRHEGRKAMAEFVRAEWSEPFRSTWDDLPAATNIIGLYWRPVDPTREVVGDGSGGKDEGRAAEQDTPTPGTAEWLTRYAKAQGRYPLTDPPKWVPDSRPKPEKHRIVHAWHDDDGYLWALGSDGRLWCRFTDGWMEEPAPPGLEP